MSYALTFELEATARTGSPWAQEKGKEERIKVIKPGDVPTSDSQDPRDTLD
jgi:hypothetical protein